MLNSSGSPTRNAGIYLICVGGNPGDYTKTPDIAPVPTAVPALLLKDFVAIDGSNVVGTESLIMVRGAGVCRPRRHSQSGEYLEAQR